jgi:hypothetical protein
MFDLRKKINLSKFTWARVLEPPAVTELGILYQKYAEHGVSPANTGGGFFRTKAAFFSKNIAYFR